jgi:uncharacterized OB-fold protein
VTVSAIEFSRLGPPKLVLYAMRCRTCKTLHPWWERYTCGVCGSRDLVEEKVEGTGELVNYTVVYYPPRDFLGQEPYVVGHIELDEGVLVPAPVVGIAPDDVEVGSRVRSTLRRMKLGHEGDIYYSQKFVLDDDPPKRRRSPAQAAKKTPAKAAATRRSSPRPRRGSAR